MIRLHLRVHAGIDRLPPHLHVLPLLGHVKHEVVAGDGEREVAAPQEPAPAQGHEGTPRVAASAEGSIEHDVVMGDGEQAVAAPREPTPPAEDIKRQIVRADSHTLLIHVLA